MHILYKKEEEEKEPSNPDNRVFIMSASELAPFVAAVIDDGIAPELQRKNQELTRKIDALESAIQHRDNERLLVQITGRHGRPIYGEKSLKKGRPCDGYWSLDFYNEDDADNRYACICPFDDEESITQLEIHVGGILIMPRFLDQLVMINIFDAEYEDEDEDEDDLDKLVSVDVILDQADALSAADFDDNECPINQLLVRVGPITVRHYKTLCILRDSGVDMFTRFLFEHNVPTAYPFEQNKLPKKKMTLTAKVIEFEKKNIRGCISLMKELGIRTL